MIRLRTKRRERQDVAASGVLSDLAFLLIVFFIVIAVFNVNSGFLLGLPQKGSVTTVHVDDLMRVEITSDNAYVLNGSRLGVAELSQAVRTRRVTQPNVTMAVTISPDATYQSLVTAVEIARSNDVDNFSFSMAEER